MSASEEILARIEDRLRDARHEIDKLSQALAALEHVDHGSANRTKRLAPRAAPRTRPRQKTAQKPSPKARSTEEVVPAGKLEHLLSEERGLSAVSLAERANGDRAQVLALLHELEHGGRVRRTGQRRGTRWFTITDEERIQKRAAELDALSNQQS